MKGAGLNWEVTVQICSQCNTQCHDTVDLCPSCGASLNEQSTRAVALEQFKVNPRVKNIRLVVAHNACPACQQMEGTYDKYQAPELPVKGCSHKDGCRCFYEPMLDEIYP
jgi:hypothetical protein